MNKTELLKQLNTYEIDCSEEQLNLLMLLMESTLSENEKFNLTAIKDRDQFVEKMIFDSAIGLRDLDLSNKSIIDVGTGAGFPGMVIRILAKDANVTLLDSTQKKIDYLKEFASNNNLRIIGVSERAEDYSRNNPEKYDYACARAVAHLSILLEIITPLLKVGGTFIAYKGLGYEDEINASKNAFKKLGLEIDHIYEITLPECQEKRAIIYIKKTKETNKKYPRQYSEIKKKPL